MATANHTQNTNCQRHRLTVMNHLVSQKRHIVHLTTSPGSLKQGKMQLPKLIATMSCGCMHELEFNSLRTMGLYTARFGFLDPFRGGVVGEGK